MKKKITILGGAGFIGHNLAIRLKSLGYQCQIIDSLEVNNLKAKKHTNVRNKTLFNKVLHERFQLLKKSKINIIQNDLKKNSRFSKKIINFKPDIIIHLAAVSHANISNIDPEYTFDNSLITLMNTLKIIKKIKSHLIFFSSSMVYGNFNGKKVDENTKCNPIGIYGNLKLAGEMMVKSYSHVFNFPYTIIRPSALYGERCVSRRVGQIFIENALQGFDLEINGDGKEKLDFTYIEDLIHGIERVILSKNSKNQIFNLTYGQGRMMRDLIKIIKKNFPSIKVRFKKRDKLVPKRGGLNINKAKKLIGYKPKFSIDKGYQKYINWYKNFYKNLKL
jgi:nucleoside-diphosphate-sugar epimerase